MFSQPQSGARCVARFGVDGRAGAGLLKVSVHRVRVRDCSATLWRYDEYFVGLRGGEGCLSKTFFISAGKILHETFSDFLLDIDGDGLYICA